MGHGTGTGDVAPLKLKAVQEYIFNVHQITTSDGKFNIFLARARTKIPLGIHQNTPFRVKNSLFSREGTKLLHRLLPCEEGNPLTTPLAYNQAFSIHPMRPRNSSQIYFSVFSSSFLMVVDGRTHDFYLPLRGRLEQLVACVRQTCVRSPHNTFRMR